MHVDFESVYIDVDDAFTEALVYHDRVMPGTSIQGLTPGKPYPAGWNSSKSAWDGDYNHAISILRSKHAKYANIRGSAEEKKTGYEKGIGLMSYALVRRIL